MDPKRTALVLIEYQNDFTSKGGTLHDAVKGVMEQNNMLQNTVDTVKKARAAGCTIVHAPYHLRRRLWRAQQRAVRHSQGRRRQQVVPQRQLGRRDRRRPQASSRAISSSKASAGSAVSPARISTSFSAAAASRRSRSAASSPTAASNRRCARATKRATRSSR